MQLPPQLLALAFCALCLPAGALTPTETNLLEPARTALSDFLPDVAATRLRKLLEDSTLSSDLREEARLLLAESLVRANQPADVSKLFKSNPSNPAQEYWLAIALAKLGETQSALDKLALIPKDSEPYWQQAAYNRLEILTSQGDPETAFGILAELREANPDFQPEALALIEAQIYLQTNKPDEARKALNALPLTSPQAQLLAGRIELSAKQPEAAIAAFDQASRDPSLPLRRLALLGRSDALLAQSKTTEALMSLIGILATEPDANFLSLLYARWESLLALPPEETDTEEPPLSDADILRNYVSPSTFGEDSNYATPAKQFALYYLSRISERTTALQLLDQLLNIPPEADLAARAQFSAAQIFFQQEDEEAARERLVKVRELQPGSAISGRAADLLARLAIEAKDFPTARSFFAEASRHPDLSFAEQALLNQTILTLQSESTPKSALSAISSRLATQRARASFLLEKVLAEARERQSGARENLETFLKEHPNHERVAEARLALAEVLLDTSNPELTLVEAQISALPTTLPTNELSLERFNVSHRLGAISDDWKLAVSKGEAHLKDYPQGDQDPLFLLRLAESAFRNGDANRARFLFNKVAGMKEAGSLRDLALLFSAQANLAVLTPSATEKALKILTELSTSGGPLATEARLRLARTYLKDLGDAEKCLEALSGLSDNPANHPEAALYAAEAYRELGNQNPSQFKKAIALYEKILANPGTSYQRSNQLHYLIARTHIESGNPSLALEPCWSVVEFENRPPGSIDQEWDYYYKCGFLALDILLDAKRYKAALQLARKLAVNGKGPGAEDASERAKQIQLEHLLFDE